MPLTNGRHNKNSEWIATASYNFTKPISGKGVANALKVALLLSAQDKIKSRSDILLGIGIEEEKATRKGHLAGLFTALSDNRVIQYDSKQKCYVKGERHKEFLQYTLSTFTPEYKNKYKNVYMQVLKEASNVAHFIFKS